MDMIGRTVVLAPDVAPSFTVSRRLLGSGVSMATCLACGAALLLEDDEDGGVDVLDLHRVWHARMCVEVPAPLPVPQTPPVVRSPALGNAVIAAAVEWDEAIEAHSVGEATARRVYDAHRSLRAAVAAYRESTASTVTVDDIRNARAADGWCDTCAAPPDESCPCGEVVG